MSERNFFFLNWCPLVHYLKVMLNDTYYLILSYYFDIFKYAKMYLPYGQLTGYASNSLIL